MVTCKINNHNFVFYDSVEDLPIRQFHRYSKYVLVEGGVGDSIGDIDRHISRIIGFLDDKEKAHRELMNLRQNLFMVMSEMDIHNKATLCLVKSVDGKMWEDFSDSGLDILYSLVESESQKRLNAMAKEVRDKIDENLNLYFPEVFSDSIEKNYIELIRKKALLQLGTIINGEDNKEKIEEINKKILGMHPPKVFEGKDSEEIKFDKQFEDMCLAMSKEFGGGVKDFTTMEFYTAFERMKKESEELKKLKNRRK